MNWYRISTGQFGYPQPEGDFGYLEATYDLRDACPICGIGKKQKNPFRFRSEPKAKRSHFLGLNWVFDQVFVRNEVKERIEDKEIGGVRFTRPVLHKSGEPMETIYQMHVDKVLSEHVIGGSLTTEFCAMPTDPSNLKFLRAIGSTLATGPFCGQQKFNYPRREEEKICVSSIQVSSDLDVVRLNDWFGSGGRAGQPIIVSERFMDLIKMMNWRGATLEPIIVIEPQRVQQDGGANWCQVH